MRGQPFNPWDCLRCLWLPELVHGCQLTAFRDVQAVFSDVTQSFIERQIDGISARRLAVEGKGEKKSLCDLGFCRVGVDSGWAECSGVNGSWHDETGHFIINRTSFPDMKAMVSYGHSRGVFMGFYLNQVRQH